MTTFSEQRLPTHIRAGMSGGPSYVTLIAQTPGGTGEARNSLRTYPKRQWEFEYTRTKADLDTLYSFFLAMKGAGIGFRFKDPFDYEVALSEGRLGTTAAGTGEPTYQLIKRYTSGALTHDENIYKPVDGSVSVYRVGYIATAGAGAGQYALSTTTGIVTWVADASQAITGHTVGSSHAFTTANDIAPLGIGDKVYITGVTGTAASLLNNIAHTISNKTGGGPYTWTISTNTGGSPTLTAVDGTAAAYPQADEALVWLGEFDRPVRFTTDDFRWQLVVRTELIQLSGVSVVELLQP